MAVLRKAGSLRDAHYEMRKRVQAAQAALYSPLHEAGKRLCQADGVEISLPYKYIAYTVDKKIVKGTINADAERLAEEALERSGHRILSLKPVRSSQSLEQLFPTFFGVKLRDVIVFSRQLANLLKSGIPLTTALHLIEEQVTSTSLKRVIAGLLSEIQGGNSLSEALAKYPRAFPNIYRQILGWGQASGNIDGALSEVVSHLERRMEVVQKVQRAMLYPALVILLSGGVVGLLLTVALPPMVGLFTGLGAELPWTTKALLSLTGMLAAQKFLIIGVVSALAILIALYVRQPGGRLMLDKLRLKMPVIRSITISSNMALFSRTMSVLLKSGIPLPQILDILCQSTGNRVLRQALGDVQTGVVQGRGLSQMMAENKVFPRLVVQMVMVGEQTGTLDSNVTALAEFYEDEVNQKLTSLTSLLEPMMTVFIGLVVGFVALSLIMPMYSIMSSIK